MKEDQTIVIADDDPEDCDLATEAMRLADMSNPVNIVRDGHELISYLKNHVDAEGERKPPAIILLDLNMPRMNGHDALKQIKADPELSDIPIIVMTTSSNEADVEETYRLGAQSYLVKPGSFRELVEKFKHLRRYWFETVRRPRERGV